ncbi:MAG: division/cell wall cluster transcriptional repressor MraZ [Lachnospiraceae bacterium]|nr:division/cell wall cluster transcriptional repressor MraZ [Lachnospiraceae bacterium]
MFMGQYNQKVDTKGRAIVPAKFREGLGEQFVITKGLDKCIFAFPLSKWEVIAEKLDSLSMTDKKVRRFIRFFLAGAATLETDKQGRVLIPQGLREYASLDKDVIWIGTGSRLEIWNPDKLNEYTEFDEDEMDEVADYMTELGISI